MNRRDQIEKECLAIYQETAKFPAIKQLLGERFGFEILMGPPFFQPPVMFIGYQPGDWELSPSEARAAGFESGWVRAGKSQYATEQWLLAKKLREIFFGKFSQCLDHSVGLNAIFVRAPSADFYNKNIDLKTRRCIADFCLRMNERIIYLTDPKKIIAIGFGAMRMFGPSQSDVSNSRSGPLTKTASIFGKSTLVVKHLTGCRLSRVDRELIGQRMREFVGSD